MYKRHEIHGLKTQSVETLDIDIAEMGLMVLSCGIPTFQADFVCFVRSNSNFIMISYVYLRSVGPTPCRAS
jgi:hypothetical protein